MAFIKYEVEQPARPQIKINSTSIVIAESDWLSAGLDGSDFVNLYWDPKGSQVGISSTTSDDRSKFSVKKSRRGITIAAKKFYDKFSLSNLQAQGGLSETGDVIAFRVKQTGAPVAPAQKSTSTETPKRRGRRPKNYVAP